MRAAHAGVLLLALHTLYGAHAQDVPVVDDAPPASGYRIQEVVSGLDHPWSMTWLPGGDILVTERPGTLRVVRDGRLLREPVTGVPDVFAAGQGGLMEVSLHPDFAENNLLYLTHSEGVRGSNHTVLARGVYRDGALSDVRTIFEVEQMKSGTQHFGSRIVWLEDGTMLLAIGDGGNPPVRYQGELIRKQAQNPGAHLGKILRLDENGEPVDDNPFVDRRGAAPEVYSWGHRNIQGMAIDRESGRVWATEHGPRGGDELNLVRAGENYGWPEVTFGREYSGRKITDQTSAPRFVDAALVWVPSKAPSGLEFYSGDAFPQWRGDLFSGGLVTKDVWRIDLNGERVVKQETISIGKRVRDVRQGPDGMLYVLTDEDNGQLLRIVPAR
ncbi:MAG: PQQ-dependent sugar dehydrogenase [Phycisphaerales bacterium]